jgi:hypothetical protein
LFLAMATQWRWAGSMEAKRCGLDYAALPAVYEGLGIAPKRRRELFTALRMMEVSALDAMHE